MSQNEIQELELSIEAAKEMAVRGAKAEKLASNPDFQKIVFDGYFVNEASRLALLYSDPNITEEQREYVHRDLIAIGGFKRYMSTLVQLGQYAANEIAQAEEDLDAIRAEELSEDDA